MKPHKSYYQTKKSSPNKTIALTLVVVALFIGAFVVINRIPKKTSQNENLTVASQNTNTKEATNNNSNKNKNTNFDTNTAANLNVEITNPITNINTNFEGVPPEILKGDTLKKQVIFTFDAGSGNQSARQILDALKKYNLKATFFMTGKWAEKNEELTEQIAAAGHEIFNHTYSHPHLAQVTDDEIIAELNKAETVIKNLTGKTTKPYFRPPYGERDSRVLEIAGRAGYQSVMWTVDALDWQENEGITAEQVKEKVLSKLAPGVIYLMHMGDTLTGKVLDDLIPQIQEKGYAIVPLSKGI